MRVTTANNGKFAKTIDLSINMAILLCCMIFFASMKYPILSNVLYASDSNYHFGTIKAGTDVKHTFVVTNLHPWNVTIVSVAGSCGCTTGDIGRKLPYQIAPFSSIYIHALLDTTDKKGDVNQHLIISTDENSGMPLLTLSGHVTKNIKAGEL